MYHRTKTALIVTFFSVLAACSGGSHPDAAQHPSRGEPSPVGSQGFNQTAPASLEELVCREFGFSYGAAQALGGEFLPRAHLILGDATQEHCWGKTIYFMGAVGGERELNRLLALVERGASGVVDWDWVGNVSRALFAVGYLAGRHTGTPLGDQATEYLIKCTESARWDQSNRSWFLDVPSEAAMIRKLSEGCVAKLGFSRAAAARAHLYQIFDLSTEPRLQRIASRALGLMDEVEASGSLDSYLAETDSRPADSMSPR